MSWKNTVIAVVAGDAREQEIARCALRAGATVHAYGFPWPDEGIEGVYHARDAADALRGADIALFPIPGITAEGALFAPKCPETIIPTHDMLAGMNKPGHIILGWADANLRQQPAWPTTWMRAWRQLPIIIVRVHHQGHAELTHVVHRLNTPTRFFRFRQRREEHACENRNDADHDQNLVVRFHRIGSEQ